MSRNEIFVKKYLSEAQDIISRLPVKKIDLAIDMLFEAYQDNKQVFFMGNGGSASNAQHFAADLSKTTIMKTGESVLTAKRFKAHSLCDNPALTSAWANDMGFESVFRGQLENVLQAGDVVIGISVHGGGKFSSNLGEAYKYAKSVGAKTIGFSGFDGGSMNQLCDVNIIVPANSTPHTESLHSVLQHMIIFCLKEKIANNGEAKSK